MFVFWFCKCVGLFMWTLPFCALSQRVFFFLLFRNLDADMKQSVEAGLRCSDDCCRFNIAHLLIFLHFYHFSSHWATCRTHEGCSSVTICHRHVSQDASSLCWRLSASITSHFKPVSAKKKFVCWLIMISCNSHL